MVTKTEVQGHLRGSMPRLLVLPIPTTNKGVAMKRKKKDMRTTEQVGDDLHKFLKPRWNIGTSFTLKDLQKYRKVAGVNPEKRIINYLIEIGFIRCTREQKSAGGRGGAVRYFRYTIRVNVPEKLDQGIEQAVKSLTKKRSRKLSRKRLSPPVNHLDGSEVKTLRKQVRVLQGKLAECLEVERATKNCPNCNFKLTKFRERYGQLLKEAIEDCQ